MQATHEALEFLLSTLQAKMSFIDRTIANECQTHLEAIAAARAAGSAVSTPIVGIVEEIAEQIKPLVEDAISKHLESIAAAAPPSGARIVE